jgi:SAM-dependent methyltransferase
MEARHASATFDELVAEGAAVPVEGWDFSWFDGRATEERPFWGYARLIGERMTQVSSALDIQTGGGEVLAGVLAGIPNPPLVLVATESWAPNVEIAKRNLRPFGGAVAVAADDGDLPFPAESFDLVVSRHPTVTVWREIARVLRPGGTYLSQQVGTGTVHELAEAMMGPRPVGDSRSTRRAVAVARAVGLDVIDLREQSLRMTFDDIGAVVHFLRKVFWTVPDFTVDRYRPQLATLHERIRTDGPFVAHSTRFLIEARKPSS